MGRLILAYGGSGSGKSAWAERTLLAQAAQVPGARAVYLAAMESASPEAPARIARHRAMREAHGAAAGVSFETVERTVDVGGAAVAPGDFVLLEDLGNLLANEIWSPSGAGPALAEDRIFTGLTLLQARAALLLVVSNDIFSDGGGYPPETMAYIRSLGSLHQHLAPLAEEVVEIVCGLPVVWKQAPGGSNPDFFTPQG